MTRAADNRQLVTAVYSEGAVVGANVWASANDEAVFVHVSDLKRVIEALEKLAEESEP